MALQPLVSKHPNLRLLAVKGTETPSPHFFFSCGPAYYGGRGILLVSVWQWLEVTHASASDPPPSSFVA